MKRFAQEKRLLAAKQQQGAPKDKRAGAARARRSPFSGGQGG